MKKLVITSIVVILVISGFLFFQKIVLAVAGPTVVFSGDDVLTRIPQID